MQRLAENVLFKRTVDPASRSAGAVNGEGFDSKGYDGVCAIVDVGAIAGSTTLDVKLQDSDDNTTFADITGASITQLAAQSTEQPTIDVRLGGPANKARYIRAVLTVGGASTAVAGVTLAFYHGNGPVTNNPASVLV